MKGLKVFEHQELGLKVRTMTNPDGSISINAEDTAIGYGWCRTEVKNGREYNSIMWARMNGFCKELGFAHSCAKDDYIPESLFYMLGFKAGNEKALKYQQWLAIEVLPSLRKTGSYEMPNHGKAKANSDLQEKRVKVMEMNARTKQGDFLEKLVSKYRYALSDTAVTTMVAKAVEVVTGESLIALPEVDKTYSATEIGDMFGVTSNKIGRIASKHNLKTDEYGITVMDKSPYSSKEIPSFRYNERGVERFREILTS